VILTRLGIIGARGGLCRCSARRARGSGGGWLWCRTSAAVRGQRPLRRTGRISCVGGILDGGLIAEKGQLGSLAGRSDRKHYGKGAGNDGHPMTHDAKRSGPPEDGLGLGSEGGCHLWAMCCRRPAPWVRNGCGPCGLSNRFASLPGPSRCLRHGLAF